MENVTVYTKYGCPKCEMAKVVLEAEGIKFNLINVEDDKDAMEYVKNVLCLSSMPVITKEGESPIVGFNPELIKELKN